MADKIKKAAYKWAREFNFDKDLFIFWKDQLMTKNEFVIIAKKMYSKDKTKNLK